MFRSEQQMQRPRSPYQVLNVSPEAEPEVIEAAYRVLMKKYHPDKLAGGPPLSESKASEINLAFNILRDPGRRARHDAEEKSRRPVIAGSDWTFDGSRAGAPFAPRTAGGPQGAPPPRPPMPPRRGRGRLVAGWTGMLVLALVIAAVLVARENDGATAQSFRASIRAAADEATEPAAGDAGPGGKPVSRRQIGEALGEFERVRAIYGPLGVAAYSDACFQAQSRTRDISDFDFCVAFDHAASVYDTSLAEPFRAPPPPRFTETQLTSRHSGAARLLPEDYETLEERMMNIRTLTYSAIADQGDKAVEPDNSSVAEPPEVAAPPGRVRRPPQRRPETSRQPAQRRQRPQQEADFVEREGGIY